MALGLSGSRSPARSRRPSSMSLVSAARIHASSLPSRSARPPSPALPSPSSALPSINQRPRCPPASPALPSIPGSIPRTLSLPHNFPIVLLPSASASPPVPGSRSRLPYSRCSRSAGSSSSRWPGLPEEFAGGGRAVSVPQRPCRLPTGTLLAFNLLALSFTNHGVCDATTALLTQGLLALSCVLASFTDSLRAPDGRVYYGLATPRGLCLLDYPPAAPLLDTARYRLVPLDLVHAALSAAVFAVVAARDKNVVRCFYLPPPRETEELLDILPLGVDVICSLGMRQGDTASDTPSVRHKRPQLGVQ